VIDGLNGGRTIILGKAPSSRRVHRQGKGRPASSLDCSYRRSCRSGNVELRVGTNEFTVAGNKTLLRRREALILELSDATRPRRRAASWVQAGLTSMTKMRVQYA